MNFKNLGKIYRVALRYPTAVFLAVLVVTGFAWTQASKLSLLTDFNSLLPEDAQSVQSLREFEENFGSSGKMIITVEGPKASSADHFSRQLARELRSHPEVLYVDYEKPVEFFQKRKWLYLEISDLHEMEKRVDRTLELEKSGFSPVFNHFMDFADEEDRPDLTFEDIRLRYEAKFNGHIEKKKGQGEGVLKILWVKTKRPANSIDYSTRLVNDVEARVQALKQDPQFAQLEIGYTGEHHSSLQEIEFTKQEISKVSAVVFITLMLILILYFRRISAAFLIGLPLAVGITWTMGIVYYSLGHLNLITGFAAAILAGLGSDYGIYLLNRFDHEKAKGEDFNTACRNAFGQTGRATFQAMITTVGTFIALLFSSFAVFVELGIMGAVGLFMNYLAMMLLMPALLCLANRLENKIWFQKLKRLDRLGMGQSPWALDLIKRIFTPKGRLIPVALFLGLVFLSVLTLPTQSKIYFEEGQLDTGHLPSSKTYSKVSEANFGTASPAVLMTQNPQDEKEVVQKLNQEALGKKSGDLVYTKIIGLSSFVPEEQEDKRRYLERISQKFKQAKYINEDHKKKISKSFSETLSLPKIQTKNLPGEIKRNFISSLNPRAHAVYLYPSIARTGSENIDRYYQGLKTLQEEKGLSFTAVDGAFIQRDLTNFIRSEAPKGMLLIALFFAVFLHLTIRPIKNAFLVWIQLMGSLVVLSGVLWICRIPLNVMNIAVIPIVLGTGIDCFLHFNNRYHENRQMDEVVAEEVPAIWISSLTSMVGFGGLLLTSSAGLRSVGWVAVLGLAVVTLVCTLVFPRILLWMDRLGASGAFKKKAWES